MQADPSEAQEFHNPLGVAPQRRAVLFLVLTLIVVTTVVGAATLYLLYEAAFQQQQARLVETVKSQARMIEAVGRFDTRQQGKGGGLERAREATLSQISDAHGRSEGFGATGEFVLAEKRGDQIVFLLRHRHGDLDTPESIPLQAEFAEPMRRALSGKSGTIVGLDYRGETVLAAHEAIPEMRWGLVAKIDLSEVRAPFVRAALLAAALALVLVLLGSALFLQAMRPLLTSMARSAERFRLAVNAAPNGMLLVDARGTIVLANEKLEETLGYSAGELLGRSVDALVPDRHQPAHPAQRASFHANPYPRPMGQGRELYALRKDGREVPVEIALTPLETPDGLFVLAALVDITERKEAAKVAVAIADGDLSLRMESKGGLDVLANAVNRMVVALESAAKQNARNLWLATARADLGRALSGNASADALARQTLEFLCQLLGAQVGSLYVADGAGLRLASTSARLDDVPSTWRLGEGLVGRAAAERRRVVLTDLPDDYMRVTSGLGDALPRHLVVLPLLHDDEARGVLELGSLREFDASHLELLDTVGRSVALAIGAAQARTRVDELLAEAQAQTEELQAQQEELRQANEELEAQTQLLEAERERTEATNRELGRARQALQERADDLTRTSQYKSDFLASMSHELRTPLNSLLILAKLLTDNPEGNLTEKQVEYAHTIHGAGTELLQLINEILDLAKIEAGKLTLEVVDYRPSDLAGYLRRSFGPVAAERGLELQVTLAADLPEVVRTDVQRLQQVLKNLLSNAFKFTNQGEVGVHVSLADTGYSAAHPTLGAADQIVAFSVRDTGIGIPEDKKQLIFEAFQQVDTGPGRQYGGTGLGLSISRELARLLGGELTVGSTPGEGSTFTLYLPATYTGPNAMAPDPREESPARSPHPRAGAPTPRKEPVPPDLPAPVLRDDRESIQPGDRVVLVIEDDLKFAGILVDMARGRGFKALAAGDGTSGLELARLVQPDAITLDLRLPDTSGWTVLDRLKHDPRTHHIPVHIVSVEEERQRGMTQGALTYLQKPVAREKLEEAFGAIESFLERGVRRLLVVEDDERERKSIVELIGSDDVEATAVDSGAAALEALSSQGFDCVVLDLGLPDMDGFELIDAIEGLPGLRGIPVIVYTGRDLTHAEELRLLRATEVVIVKDVRSPERLLAETALFLHRVETKLPEEKQRIIRQVRQQDELLAGRKVLIVDDDVRNIFALSSVLERSGMEVSYAENGPDAIEAVRSSAGGLSAVLMDIMMPGMDGYEATQAIRELPGCARLPIIAVTAKAMKGDRDKCLEAGASDYIAKPVDTEQLLSLLRVWLYPSQGSRQAGAE